PSSPQFQAPQVIRAVAELRRRAEKHSCIKSPERHHPFGVICAHCLCLQRVDGQDREANSVAQSTPAEDINNVEASRIVGAEDSAGLLEVIEIGAAGRLGANRRVEVSLPALVGQEDEASHSQESSSAAADDQGRVQ
ncbi:hypothetical protein Vretifemale_10991, partial [Volvox reticuliferus]